MSPKPTAPPAGVPVPAVDVRLFTVMRSQWNWEDRHLIDSCPATIPWGLLTPHESQVQRNHHQSLERLNERGGLTPQELYYVMHDQRWPNGGCIPMADAVAWLRTVVEAAHV